MSRRRNRVLPGAIALAAAALACAGGALAERADRDRPVNIESDRMSADDARRTAVFEGRVVLSQGSLVIRADRIEVRQDAEGFQYGIAIGSPVSFRQKREGSSEFVEGEAERIEYDGKSELVQFFNRARLRREGGDDVSGNYISYNSRTEEFSVRAAKGAAPDSRDGRVRAVIMPKKKDAGAGAAQDGMRPAPASAGPRLQ
ncbi:MAG: lipopolysaccharide transport periplasmic protein LptA [Betaproteobacteria bacterium]|nr:lipopolysaccharide transport periplasmic protein LptA [Betaproteobacteria bacterium]